MERADATEQTHKFLYDIFGSKDDAQFICIWTWPDRKSLYFNTIEEAANYAKMRKDDSDVYVGCALTEQAFESNQRIKVSAGRKPAAIAAMWSDIDIAGPGHKKDALPPSLDAALSIVPRDLPPSIIVHSGGGIQPWWLFKEPWEFTTDAEIKRAAVLATRFNRFLKSLAETKGWTLDSVGDLARVLRLPGTYNRKIPGHPREVRIFDRNEHRYNPRDIEEILDFYGAPQVMYSEINAEEQGKLVYLMSAEPPFDKLSAFLVNDVTFKLTYERKRRDLADQSASSYDLALANAAVQAAWTDQEIVNLIIHWRRKHGEEIASKLRDSYFLPTLRKARTRSSGEVVTNASPDMNTPGTVIRVTPVTVDHVAGTVPDPSDPVTQLSKRVAQPVQVTGQSTVDEALAPTAPVNEPNPKTGKSAAQPTHVSECGTPDDEGQRTAPVDEPNPSEPAAPVIDIMKNDPYAQLCQLLAEAQDTGKAEALFDAEVPLSAISDGQFSDFIGAVKKAVADSQKGLHIDLNSLKKARRQAVQKLRRASRSVNRDGKPEVIVSNRQLCEVRTEVVGHLHDSNDPPVVYQRLRELVRFRIDALNQPYLEPLDYRSLAGRISDVALIYRRTEFGDLVGTFPPRSLCEDILTYDFAPNSWPAVEAITRSPIVHMDGTVFASGGFDPISHMIYYPPTRFVLPAVPTNPTAKELKEAKQLLLGLVIDFPFESSADRTNFFGFCLTALIRPLIDVAPMGVFNSPTSGAGKGLLTDLAAIIATGEVAAVIPPPANREEWPKLLSSLLDSGRTFITFDNLHDVLKSDALEAVLTKPFLQFRQLGHTRERIVPNRAVWCVTGNNVAVSRDMVRRCFRISIDPRCAQPHLRKKFKQPNLIQYCKDERGSLLASLLVLIRNWHVEDRPSFGGTQLGTYTAWKDMVGGILKCAGFDDFLANQRELYTEMDIETEEWEAFLLSLETHTRAAEFSVKDVVDRIQNGELDLPREVARIYGQTVTHTGAKPNAYFGVQLGHILRKHCKTRYGASEVYIERVGADAHAKAGIYAIKRGNAA